MAMNNSLAEVHPELVSEWSEKNKIKPTEVSIGSHTVLYQVLQIAVDDDFIRNNPSDNVLRELKKQCTYCIGKTMICTTNCTLTQKVNLIPYFSKRVLTTQRFVT